MREPTYLVPAALLDGPLHGYVNSRRAGAALAVTKSGRGAAVRRIRSRRQARPA